jgi:hypothetical protein
MNTAQALANDWTVRDALEHRADRLAEMADNVGRMAARGQDRLALGAALDARMLAGQMVAIARELAERAT